MKKPVRITIGLIGILAALYWSVRGVAFRDVVELIKSADPGLMFLVLLLTTCNLLVRSAVWREIVRPMKNISLFNAFSSYLIGVFSNLFLPFKLGDVAQGYALSRKTHISKISLVTAVLVQRVFEITSLLLILAIIGAFFSFPMLFDRRTMLLGSLLILLVLGLILLIIKRESVIVFVEKQLGRISMRLAAAVRRTFELFVEGTQAIHSIPDILRIMGLSMFSWIIQFSMTLFMAWSLNIQVDFVSASIVLLIINIGLLLPIAPGNIGTFQFFSVIAFSLFSVSKSKALTFSILFQVLQSIPVLIGGGLSLLFDFFGIRTAPLPGVDITSRSNK